MDSRYIMQVIKQTFARSTDWRTRTGMREYSIYGIFYVLADVLLSAFVGMEVLLNPFDHFRPITALVGLVMLVLLVPLVGATIRRLHDMNQSGWWALILFFSGIRWIVVLVLSFIAGNPNYNKYGEPPYEQPMYH